jgi:hypothetical protein
MNRNANGTEWTRTMGRGAWILAIALGACVNGAGEERGSGAVGAQRRQPGECRAGDRTCSDGSCIDGAQLCDGWRDCAQGEDEGVGYGPGGKGCYDDMGGFFCGGDDWYLARELVCDGVANCDNGADELGCPAPDDPADAAGACGANFDCGDAGTCVDGVCQCEPVDGEVAACDGMCTILDTPENCGACGNACAGGQPLCWQGACQTCETFGFAQCGGECKDDQYDSWNCGECGRTCRGGRTCQAGVCL